MKEMDKIFNWISVIIRSDRRRSVILAWRMGRTFEDDSVPGGGRLHNRSNQRHLYEKAVIGNRIQRTVEKDSNVHRNCCVFSIQELIGNTIPLREVVIMFYICNEALSLLENAAVFVPIPDKLKDVLIQLRDKDTEEDIEDE